MRSTRTAVAVITLALVAAACGDDAGPTTTQAPTETSPADETTTTAPPVDETTTTAATPDDDGVVRIEIRSFAFSPSEVTVPVGTTVEWINLDAADHTTTAPGEWDALLANNDTFQYVADTPGEFNYVCNIHMGMAATLTVEG